MEADGAPIKGSSPYEKDINDESLFQLLNPLKAEKSKDQDWLPEESRLEKLSSNTSCQTGNAALGHLSCWNIPKKRTSGMAPPVNSSGEPSSENCRISRCGRTGFVHEGKNSGVPVLDLWL